MPTNLVMTDFTWHYYKGHKHTKKILAKKSNEQSPLKTVHYSPFKKRIISVNLWLLKTLNKPRT